MSLKSKLEQDLEKFVLDNKPINEIRRKISQMLWEDGMKTAHTHYYFALAIGYTAEEAEILFPRGEYF